MEPERGDEKDVAGQKLCPMSPGLSEPRELLLVAVVNVHHLGLVTVQVQVERLVRGPEHSSFATDNLTKLCTS